MVAAQGTHNGTTAAPQAVRATTRVPAQACSALATAVIAVSIELNLAHHPALPPRKSSSVVTLTIVADRNAQAGATCTALGSAANRASSAESAKWRVASSVISDVAANEAATKLTGKSSDAALEASQRDGSRDVDRARLGLDAKLRPLRAPGDATSGLALRWRGYGAAAAAGGAAAGTPTAPSARRLSVPTPPSADASMRTRRPRRLKQRKT